MNDQYKLVNPFNLWFTGLPSSGKTTAGLVISEALGMHGVRAVVLDGDIVRKGLSADLGFSTEDREENNRRIIYVSEIIVKAGIPVITTFISPFLKTRKLAREVIPGFVEVFVDTPIEECIRRDVKGLYAKAKRGEIKGMTGLDGVYEHPANPDITLKTVDVSPEGNVERVKKYLFEEQFLAKAS